MHHVRTVLANHRSQTRDEDEIQIPTHRHLDHLFYHILAGSADGTAAGTNQHITQAAPLQATQQIKDLQRTSIQVHTRFDMQHTGRCGHVAAIMVSAVPTTSSISIDFIQVKSPPQVGLRRHGEHSSSW